MFYWTCTDIVHFVSMTEKSKVQVQYGLACLFILIMLYSYKNAIY